MTPEKTDTMISDPQAVANEVVESFQVLLDSDVRDAIGEHQFYALRGLIREAIAEQSEAIFECLAQDLKQLQSETVARHPLEL